VPGIRNSLITNGVPGAAASAGIDLTTAEQSGILVLLRPQPPAARMLEQVSADQAITIRGIGTATP
jgi:hypothetical protein